MFTSLCLPLRRQSWKKGFLSEKCQKILINKTQKLRREKNKTVAALKEGLATASKTRGVLKLGQRTLPAAETFTGMAADLERIHTCGPGCPASYWTDLVSGTPIPSLSR